MKVCSLTTHESTRELKATKGFAKCEIHQTHTHTHTHTLAVPQIWVGVFHAWFFRDRADGWVSEVFHSTDARRACRRGAIGSTMGAYPRGTGSNPVEGNGHFFPSYRQLYLSSFSDTHTSLPQTAWSRGMSHHAARHNLQGLTKATNEPKQQTTIQETITRQKAYRACGWVFCRSQK